MRLLFLIPSIALVLTACGESSETSYERGYDEAMQWVTILPANLGLL